MTDTNTYDIQLFENTEFGTIQTLNKDDNVYFIAKQVIELLGYVKYRNALDRFVDNEDRICIMKSQISNSPETGLLEIPNRGLTCINESGLYSLILSSKLPSAKKFKHWVTSEVLPTIRKTGGYVNNEDLFINTYLPNADEATRLMFKTQLATIKSLNDKVGELTLTNAALAEQATTWDNRSIINALVRHWGCVCRSGDLDWAWKSIYKTLNYALGINIYSRKNKKKSSWLDVLTEDEMLKAIKVVAALCEKANINVGKIIGDTNAKMVNELPDLDVA